MQAKPKALTTIYAEITPKRDVGKISIQGDNQDICFLLDVILQNVVSEWAKHTERTPDEALDRARRIMGRGMAVAKDSSKYVKIDLYDFGGEQS